MRTYTLAFSIVIHLLAVLVMVLTPLVANDALPEPRRAFEFVTVTPVLPTPSGPPRVRNAGQKAALTNRNVAPIDAPDTIAPESSIDAFDTANPGDEPGIPDGVPGGDAASRFVGDPPPPPPRPPAPRTPERVGGVIKPPQKVRHVAPIYPGIAQSAGVHGVVILEAVIGEDGRVRNLRVLRSIPLLDRAAIDAVRQWQFTPTLLNGQPVPIVMTVTVAFALNPR